MVLKDSLKLGLVGILTAGTAYLSCSKDSDYANKECHVQLSALRQEFRDACEAKTASTFYDGSLDKIVDEREQLGCADEAWLCKPVRRTYLPDSSFIATFEYK